MRETLAVSERRACRVLGQVRRTQRYTPRVADDEAVLTANVVSLACEYGRYGYRRITALLQSDGWRVNHKRVYRLYVEEGLSLRIKRPRRHKTSKPRRGRTEAQSANECWSMDFMSDQLFDGRRIRLLTIVDCHTRESLAIEARPRFRSEHVAEVLSRLVRRRGAPKSIRCDNGPEFIATALRDWLGRVGVKTLYIEPGSPWENGYCESFNSKLRDELLAREIFFDLREAKVLIETWRRHYNTARPHSSLGYRPPHKPSCPRRSYRLTVRMWRHERRYVETAGLTLLVDHLSGEEQWPRRMRAALSFRPRSRVQKTGHFF